MCLICVEYMKNKITIPEARTALKELISNAKTAEDRVHYKKLADADDEEFITTVYNSVDGDDAKRS